MRAAAADKYKGYTVKNAVQKLRAAKGGQNKLALEYLDINMGEFIKDASFLTLTKAE